MLMKIENAYAGAAIIRELEYLSNLNYDVDGIKELGELSRFIYDFDSMWYFDLGNELKAKYKERIEQRILEVKAKLAEL
jgi:hypothetical protein